MALRERFNFSPKDYGRYYSFIGFGFAISQGFVAKYLVKNFGDLCLGVVAFFVVGYALAFSDGNEWVGDQYFGLVGLPDSLLPHVFMQVDIEIVKMPKIK